MSANYAAVLRQIGDQQREEAERTSALLARWSADVEHAIAVCAPDADPSVHFAARAIEATPHQLQEHEAVVLLGAVFRALYRDDLNRHDEVRQDAMACCSGAIDELLAAVVRQRENNLPAMRSHA